jgi:hypothetical protein
MKHHQWFARLISLNELTQAWLTELRIERPQHVLSRGLSPEIARNLWMLEILSGTGANATTKGARTTSAILDSLLDDTAPEDILGRLEQTVWSVQAWTLMSCVEKAPAETRQALESILEQSSWKLGRRVGEMTWPDLPPTARQDLRGLLLALSPNMIIGSGDDFLLRRCVANEVQVELRACPHHSRFPETRPVADLLCRLHMHWMRGFVYALNSRVTVEHSSPSKKKGASTLCLQRWFYLT